MNRMHALASRATWVRAVAVLVVMLAMISTSAGLADGAPNPRNLQERKIIETAYYAPDNTYFQLAADVVDRTGTGKWPYAVVKAKRMNYEGRQGRLAHVDSQKLHQWLVRTFEFTELPGSAGIWIGLRYWCNVRMLTWENGEVYPAGAFAPWHTPWHLGDRAPCTKQRDTAYMGVFYNQEAARWQATGVAKRWGYYLVEFPPSADAQAGRSE